MPFDDNDYGKGFPKTGPASFPRTPFVPDAKKNLKVPGWLNDPAMYHNRGDSTFAGESSEQGDFSGLDDLWTERPEVVEGMEKIYEKWVKDFAVDASASTPSNTSTPPSGRSGPPPSTRTRPGTAGRTSSCSARSTPPTPPSPPPT